MTCEMFVRNIFINSPKKRDNSNVTAFKENLQPLNTGSPLNTVRLNDLNKILTLLTYSSLDLSSTSTWNSLFKLNYNLRRKHTHKNALRTEILKQSRFCFTTEKDNTKETVIFIKQDHPSALEC